MDLCGKVVLITGGRRVGGELAPMLAGRGASVALTYKTSRGVIERTVAEVEASGGAALAVEADLARPDRAEAAVDATVARFGRLDVLVNMASVFEKTPFDDLTPAHFDAMIAANLAAPYHAAIAAARQMRRQVGEVGLNGKIINVGDWATERPSKGCLPYIVAKGGLTTLTLALAVELAPEIHVNMIQPAMIAPPPGLSEADRAAILAATPVRRSGTPGDVNRLILFLLEGTDFVTGACYRVDGGRFLGEDTPLDG